MNVVGCLMEQLKSVQTFSNCYTILIVDFIANQTWIRSTVVNTSSNYMQDVHSKLYVSTMNKFGIEIPLIYIVH